MGFLYFSAKVRFHLVWSKGLERRQTDRQKRGRPGYCQRPQPGAPINKVPSFCSASVLKIRRAKDDVEVESQKVISGQQHVCHPASPAGFPIPHSQTTDLLLGHSSVGMKVSEGKLL